MDIDFEADFWKEQFVHLLHKNMVRIGAEPLYFNTSTPKIDKFALTYPQYSASVEYKENYLTWEVFVTPSVKLRLFIQNQIKASLMQKNGSDFIKIADAKFPYDPFPEIAEFLKNKDNLTVELEHLLSNKAKTNRQLQLAKQFIKANLSQKYKNQKDVMWELETQESDSTFKLKLTKDGKVSVIILTPFDYLSKISKL